MAKSKALQRPPRDAHLHVTTRPEIAHWLRVRAQAEDVSISQLTTRILSDAMDADRDQYGPEE